MKEFDRKYTCRDDNHDFLSVSTLDSGLVSFAAESGGRVLSAHLNREQLVNLVALLNGFLSEPANTALWEDKK